MITGPLMLDLKGLELSDDEIELLKAPQVGGVILFARNIENSVQVQSLIAAIRSAKPEILIAVDQEGGRVQRVKSGVTRLPPLGALSGRYDKHQDKAQQAAHEWGWLMASEMLGLGFDISFAPVLDLELRRNEIIGDRAFGNTPEKVTALASAYLKGMAEAGMAATGKHFPGHGWVIADSHHEVPIDERSLPEIEAKDLVPFARLANQLQGIMPAHIIYESVDPDPAGFSSFWLQTILRESLSFNGVIFSDDLSMEGATVAGGYPERACKALEAGCDMVLVCNHRQGALEVLDWLEQGGVGSMLDHSASMERLSGLFAQQKIGLDQIQQMSRWQACVDDMQRAWDDIKLQ